jgi:phage tail-like protein
MMDSNNQHYFLLREAAEFAHRSSRMLWDERRGALVLAQNQALRLPASDAAAALSAWASAQPLVVDGFLQQGRISSAGNTLEYNSGRGFLPLADGELRLVDTPAGDFTDIAVGGDGRIAAGYSDNDSHGLLVFHLAKRWQVAVSLPQRPLRVWVDADNTHWCLCAQRLVACQGEPLPHTYIPQAARFEPVDINPHPLRIIWQQALEENDQPLALCSDREKIYLLVHNGAGTQTVLSRSRKLTDSQWRRYRVDAEIPFAIDMQIVVPGRLALLAPGEAGDDGFVRRDCIVVQLRWDGESQSGEALLIRERYPMLSQAAPRFVSSADGILRYQAEVEEGSEQAEAGFDVHPRELHPLQRPRYYTAARATLTQELDSAQPDTTWHRLYLEGCIPPGCNCVIYAKAFNSPLERTTTPFIQQPPWVWCSQRSDQGFGKGLVNAKKDERGLFELLLQRHTGPVRRLQGRFLQLRIRLESDSRSSPAIHALKVVYPRFSYQEAYLPAHFRQEQAVDPSLDGLAANGADVRERLFAAFEAVWTPIENRVASAEVLLSPDHTPEEHLPWLAELLGQSLPDHWPSARRRRWLAAVGELQRWHGTLSGINLALDILTDGAVARGQVVVVENFRLRRTMATLLGVSMDDKDHPLTLGTGMSGNSIVGDSLILAEADTREFLALFSPELATAQESAQVEEFFNRYANRVTVLLHGQARQMKSIVEAALLEQMPAHLQWKIVETDHPFVLGLAPLLGIDTFIERRPPAKRVKLDYTYLGREGLLQNPAAFSPRDVNIRPDQL